MDPLRFKSFRSYKRVGLSHIRSRRTIDSPRVCTQELAVLMVVNRSCHEVKTIHAVTYVDKPSIRGWSLERRYQGRKRRGQSASAIHVFRHRKAKFREDPDTLLRLRKKIEAEITLLFPFYIKGTELQKKMLVILREEMMRRLGPGHNELKVSLKAPNSR